MYDVNFPSKSDHFSIIYDFKIESYDTSALNYCNQISHNVVFDLSKQEQINSNMDQHNNSIDNVDNGNRCRSPSIRRHDDPSLVIVDVEAAELLQQSAYPTHQQQQLIDEQALLKTVTVNRGAVQQTTSNCYTEYVRIPLTYVIGVPFCWLLLGVFQYFGCVAVLGDNLLDPWYFTCAWLVEIVCTLHAVVIFMIVKCTYVRVMFGSFSRCLRYVNYKNKQQKKVIPMLFDVTKQQIYSDADRGNDIELQELNYYPNKNNKILKFSSY
ncbi:uncharacterized protein LOC126897646 isoform X4 [Daktulosphaira vitifoliae]|uniref:uncharacterized protein LOC126897646 isoform X4 n=1 Tax=Daktulosphaira vitifoliae TaxID=58002 RepID=UPI0021AAABE8|nr:uncharacterized protein LOC126897646 isoform X4 [Daktulosphaira vitifoliae]